MSKVEITKEIETDKVEGTLLGQRVSAPLTYTPEILVKVPRSENRTMYDIDDSSFGGMDDWYCYECSTLTENGVPVYFGMVISYPSDSQYIVESKSLKLYLNSFNMERQIAKKPTSAEALMMSRVRADLQDLLGCRVRTISLKNSYLGNSDAFTDLATIVDVSNISCEHYEETPSLLRPGQHIQPSRLRWKFEGFRSNCKVTHQPDYATILIDIDEPGVNVDPVGLYQYLSSFRGENHFHEECVEAIFKRLDDFYKPNFLMVRGNYTRRGGIDINPTRWTKTDIWTMDNPVLGMTRTIYQ